MTRLLTATYENRQDAERVRERLTGLGVDPARIRVQDERIGADPKATGIFDTLAQLIAPAAASRPRWQLLADVEPALFEPATGALHAGTHWAEPEGRLEPRTFIFRETSERLVIEKEVRVREEVILSRHAEVHVEEVHDSVRRMEADVERLTPADLNGARPR